MKQLWLKKIRVVVALVFLALSTVLFVDFDRIGATPWATLVLYPQFLPSLLQFTQTLAWTSTGFLLVLVLTALFGRVYCSTICPLGTLQDIFIRIADKLRKPRKVKFRYQKPHEALRYGILALAIGLFLSGSTLALSLLDPLAISAASPAICCGRCMSLPTTGSDKGWKRWAWRDRFPCNGKRRRWRPWPFPHCF